MADFAEAVLHLQAYQKIKSDTNWKEIKHVLQCYHTVQEYSEENEVLKQLCNNIFDEEFLKILSDHLGAKYLGFFSSRSLKTREKYISFAQLVLLSLYIF